ncbi:MAG: glycosyltransferase N-terminal domain-containing protein [Desulfovibrionales bacterium]
MLKKTCLFFSIIYSLIWIMATPFIFFSRRLKPGFKQRLGRNLPSGPFDIWIQAASVGECKLAVMLAESILSEKKSNMIISTCTKQGFDMLQKEIGNENIKTIYFPFDAPCIIQRAANKINPKKMVLLETEIWPGLMAACQKKNIPVIIANARMSTKSYSRYLPLRSLLQKFSPQTIVCVSEQDARRYRDIFPSALIIESSNMKFDALDAQESIPFIHNPLAEIFGPGPYLFTLASVREQEEKHIQKIIQKLLERHPKAIIALFPRHMHRINAWEDFLSKNNIPYSLRSTLEEKTSAGTVILWDRFGELQYAYALSRAAYVGGSLVPCGGQNFLEAVQQGLVPCIGPHWSNFAWAGREILDKGLVREVHDPALIPECLDSNPPSNRETVRKKFKDYIEAHKGATRTNQDAITNNKYMPPA